MATGILQIMRLLHVDIPATVLAACYTLGGGELPFLGYWFPLLAAGGPSLRLAIALLRINLDIAVGYGLLRGQRWAWIGAQIWTTLLLLEAAGRLFSSQQSLGSAVAVGFVMRLIALACWRRSDTRAFFAKTVAKPLKYQRLLRKIDDLIHQQNESKALALCQKVIRDLTAAPGLTPEHRECLGLAYLNQGRIQEQQNQASSAAESYLEARFLVDLPAPALSFLALYLASQEETSERAMEVYLDYLRLRRGQSRIAATDPVYLLLQNRCRVDAEAPSEQCQAAIALNRRVLEADDTLEWAHYYLGLALAGCGDYAQALPHLETAERLNPVRREATYFVKVYQGLRSEGQGDRRKALKLFREAVDWIGERPEAYFFLARSLVSEGEALEEQDEPGAPQQVARLAAEAIKSAAQAVSLRPRCADYHFYHGRACSLARDSQAAVKSYQEALKLNPNVKEYHLALAIEWSRLSEQNEALQSVQRAVALDRGYAEGYRVWGDLLTAAGQYDQAVNRYRRALTLDSKQARARLGLGRAFYHQGHWRDAIVELEPLQSSSREADYLLARCYMLTDQFAQAVPLLKALAVRPDASAEVFYALGCAHANLGQFPPAVEALSACLRLEPTRWLAHLQRGHCYLMVREWDKARSDYQEALSLQPQNPDVSLALARYHLMQGEESTARRYLEQVVGSQPTHWEANMMLGAMAEKADDPASAEKAYLAALKAQSDRPEPCVRLGVLYCHQGRPQEACQYLERAAAAGQESDTVLFHWGHARAACGDYLGALEMWHRLYQRHPDDQRLALNLHRLYYLLGRQHVEAERYGEAIQAWEEFFKSRPEDEKLRRDIAELYFRLGVAEMANAGDLQQARANLDSAIKFNDSHPFAPFYLALCDLAEQQPKQAIQRFAALPNGQSPALQLRAMYHRGIAFLQAGQYARAAEVLRAVADHPNRLELGLPVDWALALAYARSEQWEESLAALKPLVS